MRRTILNHRYLILERLGAGGMATVWLAMDIRLRRRVAVKILTGMGPESAPAAARRFEREAQVLAGLVSPHLVTVHDTGETRIAGQPALYLVMERVEGEPLDQVLERGLPAPAEVARWGRQICAALQLAHETQVVHRDLKPQNVMLDIGGNARVLDFGIAALLAETAEHTALTRTGVAVGTPAYMSPEQVDGRTVDARSDLYSLGCLLYALLTRRPPFVSEHLFTLLDQHRNQPPEPPSHHRSNLSRQWDRLLLDLLAKRPEDRPGTALEVGERLRAVVPQQAGPPEPPGTAGPSPRSVDPDAPTAGVPPRPPTLVDPAAIPHTPVGPPTPVLLATGQKLPLAERRGGRLIVGVGWDWPRADGSPGAPGEPGVSVLGLGCLRKVASDRHFVFAKNLTTPDGAIHHHGEQPSQTGDYRGIDLDLSVLPWRVRQVWIVLHADPPEQPTALRLNQVRGGYLRICTAVARKDWARYEMPTGPPAAAAVIGRFRRRPIGGWVFVAGGRRYRRGLAGAAKRHGTTLESPAEREARKQQEKLEAVQRRAAERQAKQYRQQSPLSTDVYRNPFDPERILLVLIGLFYIGLAAGGIWLLVTVLQFISDVVDYIMGGI